MTEKPLKITFDIKLGIEKIGETTLEQLSNARHIYI